MKTPITISLIAILPQSHPSSSSQPSSIPPQPWPSVPCAHMGIPVSPVPTRCPRVPCTHPCPLCPTARPRVPCAHMDVPVSPVPIWVSRCSLCPHNVPVSPVPTQCPHVPCAHGCPPVPAVLVALGAARVRSHRRALRKGLLQRSGDDMRDNILNYDEQGGGEEDQVSRNPTAGGPGGPQLIPAPLNPSGPAGRLRHQPAPAPRALHPPGQAPPPQGRPSQLRDPHGPPKAAQQPL